MKIYKVLTKAMFIISGILASTAAFAHHLSGGMMPETMGQGLLSGIGHPIIGIDHFAFLLIVGLLIIGMKTTQKLSIPLAFVIATMAGTFIHLAATDVPLAETIIAASVSLGGVLLLLHRDIPSLIVAGFATFFGVFHGYAYGEAIIGAETTPLVVYLAGFAFIQYLIIVTTGIVANNLVQTSPKLQGMFTRLGGAISVLTGGMFMAMSLA